MFIGDFRGDKAFLSNFYPSEITIDGIVFASVEQYFQWCKCLFQEDRDAIMKNPSPSAAKAIGRKTTTVKDWSTKRLEVMRKGVRAKFEQNEDLMLKLVFTYPEILEEGNTWKDKYWGVDYYTRQGQNHLGKILMDLRYEFIKKIKDDDNNKLNSTFI